MGIAQGSYVLFWTNHTSSALLKRSFTTTYLLSHQDGHCWRSSEEFIRDILLSTATCGHITVLTDQQKLTFINSVWILNIVQRNNQESWPIGMNGVRDSRESVQLVCRDDYDDGRHPFPINNNYYNIQHFSSVQVLVVYDDWINIFVSIGKDIFEIKKVNVLMPSSMAMQHQRICILIHLFISAGAGKYTVRISAMGVRPFPPPKDSLVMTLNHLMVTLQTRSFGKWREHSLPLLLGPLCFGVIVPVKVLSMGHIEMWSTSSLPLLMDHFHSQW